MIYKRYFRNIEIQFCSWYWCPRARRVRLGFFCYARILFRQWSWDCILSKLKSLNSLSFLLFPNRYTLAQNKWKHWIQSHVAYSSHNRWTYLSLQVISVQTSSSIRSLSLAINQFQYRLLIAHFAVLHLIFGTNFLSSFVNSFFPHQSVISTTSYRLFNSYHSYHPSHLQSSIQASRHYLISTNPFHHKLFWFSDQTDFSSQTYRPLL